MLLLSWLTAVSVKTAFAPRKAVEYALDLLVQSGMTEAQVECRRQQLETCPECRRKQNMLDGENVFHGVHLNGSQASEERQV